MSSMIEPETLQTRRDAVLLMHRWIGLLAVPFLFISIVIAVSLTHTRLVHMASEAIYPSLPIPDVRLDEPVRPGSWDQAMRLTHLAAGADGQVITTRGDGIIAIAGFVAHSHDPAVAKKNPQTQYLIDTATMRIVRVEDKTTSLFSQAHGVHAFRFFGIEWMSIAMITTVSLLALLFTGVLLGRRDRKAGKTYSPLSGRHVRAGQILAVLILAITLTTLDLEWNFTQPDRQASHPIPPVKPGELVRPGSLDQAKALVEKAIGSPPRAVFIQGRDSLKFSEAGDGIGGYSVWVNGETMTIKRITDWRNDRSALSFIIHDGRWLGGMNAFNVNDAAALGLVFLSVSGALIYRRKRRDRG